MRTTIFLSTLLATAALAQEGAPRRGPPTEALTACSGQSDGTACGFTLNGKNVVGTCRAGPNGEAAACFPEGGPGGGRHHGPPPEATTACASLSAGASCSFSHGDRTMNGTCRTGPGGEALACMPEGGPKGGGHRGPPPEAAAACKSLSAGASCSFTHGDRTMTGTCRTGPDGGETLACAPARPPQQ